MINLRRILKDYEDVGAFQALVGVQSAIGDGVFVTKAGHLVMFLSMQGVDPECLDPELIDQTARRFESALRIFDERFRLFQYLQKKPSPVIASEPHAHPVVAEATANRLDYLQSKGDKLYVIESYIAVVYEGWTPASSASGGWKKWLTSPVDAFRARLSTAETIHNLQEELDATRELLTNRVNSFIIQARDVVGLEVLDRQRGFAFLKTLLNYSPLKAGGPPLKYNEFVDFQACNSALECHRDFLRLDENYVQVLTLKEPPARSFANMLGGLLEIPSPFIIATEWKRESALVVRKHIQSHRRHFHNVKSSLLNYASTSASTTPRDMLIDDGAVAVVSDLGSCLEEIETRGNSFGQFSLTAILYGPEQPALRRAVAQCFKVVTTHDGQLTEERYNRLNAWLAVQPGNTPYNLRRIWLSSTNYADLSFLCAPQAGQVRNEQLGREYLAVLEGSGGMPYFLNLHHKDVAHSLILGATGSGKSFLLNFLLTHLQKYEPHTFVFDLGGSYECLTQLFGGSHLRIGASQRPFTINPFSLPPTEENLAFLFSFLRVLVERNGFRMSSDDEKDLYDQIKNLYIVSPDQRRLFTLSNIVRRPLRVQLQKWVQGGPYGSLFDNTEDNLTVARFQTFDFEGMDRVPEQLEPLLFYVLHRASAAIHDSALSTVLKIFVIDEAWRFFQHAAIRAYIVEGLKTWRKKNAAMILATQSGGDLLASEMLSTVVESCPTKLFLANPGMDQDVYRRVFHLNAREAELIAGLTPKHQFLMKQPGGSKLLNLEVDRKGYWLYTNNPQDNERRRFAFERLGFREGLESLAKENV